MHEHDRLAPARGCLIGLVFALGIWILVAVVLWLLLR
jgi:hypothetical protein